MKFSKSFDRDYSFYFENMDLFTFSGHFVFVNSNYSDNTVKEAFYIFDSTGKSVDCEDPNLLTKLIKSKASCNWHIKQYAIDRAKGFLSLNELKDIIQELKAPEWFLRAVENQKANYL